MNEIIISTITALSRKGYQKWNNRLSREAKGLLSKFRGTEMALMKTDQTGEFLRINLHTSFEEDLLNVEDAFNELIEKNIIYHKSGILFSLTSKGKQYLK